MARLQVCVAEVEAMLTPFLNISDLLALLMLEQIALAQEVVGPDLITSHLADKR